MLDKIILLTNKVHELLRVRQDEMQACLATSQDNIASTGRPTLIIDKDQVEYLRASCQSWKSIASQLGKKCFTVQQQ